MKIFVYKCSGALMEEGMKEKQVVRTIYDKQILKFNQKNKIGEKI